MENLRRKDQDTSAMTTGLRHAVEAVGRGCVPRWLVVTLDWLE